MSPLQVLTLLGFITASSTLNIFECEENKGSSPYTTTCTISNLHLGSLDKYTFRHNYLASTVVFKNSEISVLPAKFFTLGPERVYVEEIGLRSLIPYTFNGARVLKEFHARGNLIQSLEEKTFIGARELVLIDLSENQINVIDDSAFEGLPNLRSISLAENQLKVFRNDWFKFSKNFEYINLAFNTFQNTIMNFEAQELLTSLDIKSIGALTDIQVKLNCLAIENIDVSSNANLQLFIVTCKTPTSRPVNLIADSTKLGAMNPSLYLDPRLAINRLDVDSTGFLRFEEISSFETLKELSLGANKFTVLPGSFQLLAPGLEALSLHGVKLDEVNGTDFQRFSALKVLDFSNMDLEQIEFENFKHKELEELYLNENKLTIVDGIELLKAFPRVRFINLRGNTISAEDQVELRHLFNAAGTIVTF